MFNQVRIVSAEEQVVSFSRAKRLIGFICVALTLAAAVGEASHVHLQANGSPIRCSICVAAHSAKPAPICHPVRALRVFAASAIQQTPIVGSRLTAFGLFIRPPPFAS
jgi:hypothetical protein